MAARDQYSLPGARDLLDLGQHCSASSCGQIDFLPFKCDCCFNVFCLEHRTYASHACPKAAGRHTEVIVCPICAKAVRLAAGQDANAAFEAHSHAGCDPKNYDRVHKKPRCLVAGCKEKLNAVNTYHCKDCSRDVCMRHRDRDDHGCKAAQAEHAISAAAAQRSSPLQTLGNYFKPLPAQQSISRQAVAQRQYGLPGNSVLGTAQRRRELLAQQQASPTPQAPTSNPVAGLWGSTVTPAGCLLPEACPQCGARFASVERLVQHSEDFHPAATSISNGRGGDGGGWPCDASGRRVDAFRCAMCQRSFADAVHLLNHTESKSCRPGGSKAGERCVLC